MVSPHGLAIAAVQLGVVLFVWWLSGRWMARKRRGSDGSWFVPAWLALALVVWYAVLRVQPYRMSGTVFEYTLGLFDGVTVLGVIGLFWLHAVRQRAADASRTAR